MNERFTGAWHRLQRWLTGVWPRWIRWRVRRPRTPAPHERLPAPPPLPLPLAAYATVVIPALDEAVRIAGVVAYAWADAATAEVLVIDDSSVDDTAVLAHAAGARVITSSMLGKGASMHDGAREAACAFVVYLDGDLAGLEPRVVSRLCEPLLRGEADFVKARFGRGGGRVTELTAKPMLNVFFPELAQFGQPLGGVVAARRELLQQMRFEDGYGVDVGLLIDAWRAGARLAEVDIGSLEHDSQPLQDLTAMANEVSRVIYSRAREAGRLHVDQVVAVYESQRQAAASLEYIVTRLRGRQRLLLLDMDGTLTRTRFALELARVTGQEAALAQMDGEPAHSERVAALFRFVHRAQFERVAHALPLRPGVGAFVNRMRRAGFMVGVLSDSYFVAAETVRRRIFADFALAHTLQFDGDICTGQLRTNPAFLPLPGSDGPALSKGHVLRRFRAYGAGPPIVDCWAIGDRLNDLDLLREAQTAFVIEPEAAVLRQEPRWRVIESFEELLPLIPEPLVTVAKAA